jgi:hypothetical protein
VLPRLAGDARVLAWASFCWWRWRGRTVFPRRRMDFRGCHCASLSSPFFERPVPAEINQDSNDYYFEEQSHTKCEIRKRLQAKAILILFCMARRSQLSSRHIQRHVPKRPLRRSMTFDQEHICLRCAMAHLPWFAVLFTVEPFLGAIS